MAAGDLTTLDDAALEAWLLGRRWFGSKARDVAQIHILDVVALDPPPPAPPSLAVALVEARFPGGTHDLYQLPLALRAGTGGDEATRSARRVAALNGSTVVDALEEPEAVRTLARLLGAAAVAEGAHAQVRFEWLVDVEPPSEHPDVRPMGADQSNSSVVLDERLVLKAYRRVEAGDNPELEMLRFLSARGFGHVAQLAGWYEYEGELLDATLGIVQRFVAGARDGWELTLDEMGSPELIARLRELGIVIGRMHSVLASDATDPAFAPEEAGEESLSLLTATIDEEIERAFVELPADDPAVADIAGRGEEVRDRLRLLSHVGARGKLIRHHGDLHLGQTLLAADGAWMVLDFEGEPARPLLERRRKRSPLRDVAGMLRSFAYAASAADLQRATPAPPDWEDEAREAFLAGYRDAIDPALMPPGEGPMRTLLSIFELEKAVYELRYELNNRPDWVGIPVAGIRRLLEEPIP
jgi:maltokinase